MSDSPTSPPLPALDHRLRRLLLQWEEAQEMGRPITARSLCPDDEALAARLQAHIDETLVTNFRDDGSDWDQKLKWVGNYKVLRHLGEGGSSNVYLCEAPNLNRCVALKLLKASQCDDTRQRRFQFEIDLLATLEHPGIARIFDVGVADIGRGPQPFYTMEYVEGQRLDHFLAGKAMDDFPITDRIHMFLRIAAAVRDAHEQGIVHRDLKPSNLLVTETGQVKVIDFGLAGLSDAERTVAVVTKTGHIVGTPLYMSPEQFSEDHRLVDARSDIYGLGLVLYQMLAERLPYDLSGKPLVEIANTVIHQPAIPLGKRNSRCRGDLEVIVGKTLQKEPAHRYQSVAALFDDLQRYLDGRAILAKRPRAIDPILLWCRRNPVPAVLTGIAAVLLLATSVIATASTIVANRRAKQVQQQSALGEQRSIHLEDANEELRATLGRIQQSTSNATLMRIALSVEYNPPLARTLLFDTNLIPANQRGFAWKLLERQSDWEHVRGRWDRGPVLASTFSGDGQCLAAAALGAIDIRRTSDLSMVWSLKDRIEHPTMIALDSSGRRVAYRKPDFSIWLFEHQPRAKRLLTNAGERATALAWSPSDTLAIGFDDGAVRLFDPIGQTPPRDFKVGQAPVVGLQFSGDESVLHTVGRDAVVQTVDLTDGAINDSYSLGVQRINKVQLYFDGRFISGGKKFKYVAVWDRQADRQIALEESPGPFVNVAVLNSAQPKIAIATRGRIILRRPARRPVMLHLSRFPVRTLTALRDPPLLMAGDGDGTIILFRADARKDRRIVDIAASKAAIVRFLDSGKTIAVCGGRHPSALHDATLGTQVSLLPETASPIVDAERNSEGTLLYYSSAGGDIGSWDIQQSKPGPLQTKAEKRLVDISLVNNDKTLVGVTVAGQLHFYDLESGSEQTRLVEHQHRCSAIAISNADSRLFTADIGGIIKSWDLQTGEQFAATEDVKGRIYELTLHPDEHTLAAACGDGYVRIYETESLSLLQELIVHTSAVRSLDFSPDGTTLATGGLDSRMILWDTKLWQPQLACDVDGDGILSVRFSPNGKRLVVGGNHNQLLVWEIE